jgi:hypothetical protein
MAMTADADMNEMAGEMSLADMPDAETFEAMHETIADGSPELAQAFLQTVEKLIEALQQVSEAPGQGASIAHDALIAAGLTPRGRPVGGAADHEARHVVAAKKLGLVVERACAADGDARTNYSCWPRDLEKAVTVALAGPVGGDPDPDDEASAYQRAEHFTRLHHGIALDAAPSAALRTEAAAIVERSRRTAARLVAENADAIRRVAAALADGRVLDGNAVDKLIEE